MYWYEIKRGKKTEKRYVADHIVLKISNPSVYFNNKAINRWGYIDDMPVNSKEKHARHNTNTDIRDRTKM